MTDSSHSDSQPLLDLIRQRRTVHDFEPGCPPKEAILRAVELARWVPNHHHTEPWRFIVIGPETAQKIVDLNAELVTARKGPEHGEHKRKRWSTVPGWIAVTCPRTDDEQRQNEDYAACCCAIHNFSLSLWSEGIGVKWTTGDVIRHPRFFEFLGIDPLARLVVGLLWYGYPATIPPAQSRKPVEEILTERP
jgi:nitroreductase